MFRPLLIAALLCAGPVAAEYATYGTVELTGLSREMSWPANPPGPANAMVCNVSGPDGFLAVREGPGSEYPIRRKLKRLAVLHVDTGQRRGHWVRVTGASRSTDSQGRQIPPRELAVTGWAHDGYLCGFLD